MEDDELAQIRDQFYVGYYENCISNLLNISPQADSAQTEKEGILLRAKLSLNQLDDSTLLANNINVNAPPASAVLLFNSFIKAASSGVRQSALNELSELLNKSHDLTTKILLASAHAHEQNYNRAVELTENGTLEMMALRAMILLLMHRYDLAEKTYAQMSRVNDDSGITKLVSAWMNIVNGNSQESFLTFGDIQSDFVESDGENGKKNSLILLNGKGIAHMMGLKCRDALEHFEEAYKQNPRDVDTLVNLNWCYRNLHKHDKADALYNELASIAPEHPIVKKTNSLNEIFDAYQKSLA